ncbi:MAG: aminotransferase class I/II-fold pyridoxal phosphate-dependent enzyme [Parachlamydiaceae bacterium]
MAHDHLLDIDGVDDSVLYIPPEEMINIPIPKEHWYEEEYDHYAHSRPVRLTRGMHLISEWWKKQDFIVHYHISDYAPYLLYGLPELENEVRTLHHLIAPHQQIKDRELVFGLGATQIIHASLYALALAHSIRENPPIEHKTFISPLFATQQEPGYIEYGSLIEVMHLGLIKWLRWSEAESVDPKHLLEFITTPNNPDGAIHFKKTNADYTLHDRVNHWPFFLNRDDSIISSETFENDMISIFSLSKILSFSGARLGYAFVKDPEMARFMRYYILMDTHGLVSDAQHHALFAMKHLFNGRLEEYSNWIKDRLNERWDLLEKNIKYSPLELLNFQGPTAWVKAPRKADEYFKSTYNVEATYGHEYGYSSDHIRLNMLSQTNEFNEFIWRLQSCSKNS